MSMWTVILIGLSIVGGNAFAEDTEKPLPLAVLGAAEVSAVPHGVWSFGTDFFQFEPTNDSSSNTVLLTHYNSSEGTLHTQVVSLVTKDRKRFFSIGSTDYEFAYNPQKGTMKAALPQIQDSSTNSDPFLEPKHRVKFLEPQHTMRIIDGKIFTLLGHYSQGDLTIEIKKSESGNPDTVDIIVSDGEFSGIYNDGVVVGQGFIRFWLKKDDAIITHDMRYHISDNGIRLNLNPSNGAYGTVLDAGTRLKPNYLASDLGSPVISCLSALSAKPGATLFLKLPPMTSQQR